MSEEEQMDVSNISTQSVSGSSLAAEALSYWVAFNRVLGRHINNRKSKTSLTTMQL